MVWMKHYNSGRVFFWQWLMSVVLVYLWNCLIPKPCFLIGNGQLKDQNLMCETMVGFHGMLLLYLYAKLYLPFHLVSQDPFTICHSLPLLLQTTLCHE